MPDPTSGRFETALAAIDAANAEDPEDKEPIYAERMTERLRAYVPDASEALRLAARAHHIRRWEIPRDSYPEGRQGYHAWRRRLYEHHSDLAGTLLAEAGYAQPEIERVQHLLQRRDLKTDPETQALEDVGCLVFLEHYFADFQAKHPREKVIHILRRTLSKMSPRGHETALGLSLSPETGELVQTAWTAFQADDS